MIHDVKRWDAYHKKIYDDTEKHSRYAEEKEAMFPPGGVVVDLGGGTGADALYFLEKGHSVVIFDISEYALQVAREKAVRHNLASKLVAQQVDFGLHQFPLKDNSIDAAYSRMSLHYFPTDQTIKIFADTFRILKPGMKAYLTFKSPDDKDEYEYLQNTASLYEPNVFISNGQLRSRFTQDELKAMLSEAGVRNFQVNPITEDINEPGQKLKPVFLNEIVFTKD
jgi:ubiquinone/menaquinone biosynthesis C-methylase UbiE